MLYCPRSGVLTLNRMSWQQRRCIYHSKFLHSQLKSKKQVCVYQHQKYNAIRTCGHKALNKLNKHTVIPILPPRKDTGNSAHSTQPEEQAPVTHIDAKFKRPVLPTPAIRFDPDKFDLPPIPNSADKRKGRSGHFLQP